MFRENSVSVFLKKLIESAPKTPLLVLSRVGGGKTQIFRNLLEALISRSEIDPSIKIILTDQKGIFFQGLPVSDKSLILLDPMDSRSACWDLAKDLADIDEVALLTFSLNIVESIYGSLYGENDFFWKKTLAYELRDAINFCRQEMLKTGVSWQWKDLKHVLELNLKNKESNKLNNSVSLMAEQLLSILDKISEVWEQDPTRIQFSFKNWFNQEHVNVWRADPSDLAGKNILVLKFGKDHEGFFPMIVNSFMSILLLNGINKNGEEDFDKRKCFSWVLLDEAATIPFTENVFRDICSGGRRPIQFVFGYQDLDQISKQFNELSQKDFLHLVSGIILGGNSLDNNAKILKKFSLSWTLTRDLGPKNNGIHSVTTLCGEWIVRKIVWPFVNWKERRSRDSEI